MLVLSFSCLKWDVNKHTERLLRCSNDYCARYGYGGEGSANILHNTDGYGAEKILERIRQGQIMRCIKPKIKQKSSYSINNGSIYSIGTIEDNKKEQCSLHCSFLLSYSLISLHSLNITCCYNVDA